MQLYLFHGRKRPDEHLQDWGFDGPTINEITSLTGTYGEMYVHFENEQHLYKAQKQTGGIIWRFCIGCEVSRGSSPNDRWVFRGLGFNSR
ncbi:TPA: hypothetical protein JBF03_10640 [Legionella pneumophila]|nr:hypothetical protein [Legionella pneumophila]HAU1915577.1 hypothetical protein [Legionella pneumophila]HCU6007738.1 hypothetical protein [Legionella pneumophila]